MRKWICPVTSVALFLASLCFALAVLASPATRLVINGKLMKGHLLYTGGRHYVAIGDLADHFGTKVEQQGDTIRLSTYKSILPEPTSVPIPEAELPKLELDHKQCRLQSGLTQDGLTGTFYNGSAWNITKLGVVVTVTRADGSQRLSRFYDCFVNQGRGCEPLSATGFNVFETSITLDAGEKWSIGVVSARGYRNKK